MNGSLSADDLPIGRVGKVSRVTLQRDLSAADKDVKLQEASRSTEVGFREIAFYLAEMEAKGEHQMFGYRTAVQYAVERLELRYKTASELRRVGRELEELPLIDEAFCGGELSWSRVRLLTRVATGETEAEWLALGVSLTRLQLEGRVARGEKGRPPRDDALGLPRVMMTHTARLGVLDHEKWEIARRKLEAEQGQALTDAEVMVMAAEMIIQRDADGSVPGRKKVHGALFKVVVHQQEDGGKEVLTEAGPMELTEEEAAEVPGDAPRVLLDRVAVDEDAPVTPAMRRHVFARDDNRCVHCGSRDDLHAHHIILRSRGGKTKLWNLTTLCARSHALVHENLLLISGKAPDALLITDRLGRSLKGNLHARELQIILPEPLPASRNEVPVVFGSIASAVDVAWWQCHAHLLTWREREGTFLFETGFAREEEEIMSDDVELRAAHRPGTLSQVIGQERAVTALREAASAARIRGRAVDHVLLTGPPGLGKTSLARALAAETGGRLHVMEAALIRDAGVLIKLLTAARAGDVIFIDEIHSLGRRASEVLYNALEDRSLTVQATDGHWGRSIRIELAPITIIGATTDPDQLPDPLVSRFPIRESLEFYGTEELAEIVLRGATREEVELCARGARLIAAAARGTPREALSLLKRVRNRSIARELVTNEPQSIARMLASFGIDEEGLGPVDRKILGILKQRGRPVGLAQLAALTGLSPGTIKLLHEPFLLRIGRMARTPHGRVACWQPLRAVGQGSR